MCGMLNWCNGSKSFGAIFGYIPLSLFCLISSIYLISWGTFDCWLAAHSDLWPDFGSIFLLLLGVVKFCIGLGGVFSVIAKQITWPGYLVTAYKLVLLSAIITFVIMWIYWIIDMAKGQLEGTTVILANNIYHIIFFIGSWWAITSFRSLEKVFKSGGTGWERLSYREIDEGGKRKNRLSKDEEDEEEGEDDEEEEDP